MTSRPDQLDPPVFPLESGGAIDSPATVEVGAGWLMSMTSPVGGGVNQDRIDWVNTHANAAVLILADGMGGERAGEKAAAAAVDAMRSCVEQADTTDSLRAGILDGFDLANRRVLEMGIGAATTLAVVELQQEVVRPYHVGDSIILVAGQRGKIKLQTISHSPVGFAVESGLIGEQEAMHHEDRHIVANVVGSTDMRIDIGSPLQLSPRDTLLIASDGLTDNLHLNEIVDIIRCGSVPDVREKLVSVCHQRMCRPAPGQPTKPDDLSFILYRLSAC